MSADAGGATYQAFASRLVATGLVTDPWIDGAPRFGEEVLVLDADRHAALAGAAEAVAAVLDEMTRLVSADPSLLQSFFAMTPVQRLMWQASAPLWHAIARADVFFRSDGSPVVCEVNCDTPSALPEAVCLGRLAARPDAVDPNAALQARVLSVLDRYVARVRGRHARPEPVTAGIVYPTDQTEDLSLIALYRQWAEQRGWRVVLGAPENLRPAGAGRDGGVALFGARCDLVLRHYKTDWWGERLPIWDDEAPYPDAEPLAGPLAMLLDADVEGHVAVVNPFGAVLPQNKRAFAFLWEEIHRFSDDARAAIRALVPYTVRLETLPRDQLLRDREAWVLKSDYGCEGEEVIVGASTAAPAWEQAVLRALPGRWVAQRYFESTRDGAGRVANHGVFLVGGRSAGLFTRVSVGPTDARALSVATLVRP